MQRDIFTSNPVINKRYIKTVYQGETEYIIYNATGAIFKTGTFDGSADIDVSSLPASLYLIRFLGQGNSMVRKFINPNFALGGCGQT